MNQKKNNPNIPCQKKRYHPCVNAVIDRKNMRCP
jgi:hypothetical protein